MANRITGFVAVALIVIFLGYYAIMLESIPLWIIIVSILAMVAFDFYQSVHQDNNQTGNGSSSNSSP